MISLRSFIPVPLALFVATAAIGCSEDKPKPDPSATPTATASASAKGRLNVRAPLAPTVKVDPQANKEYRVDVCYFGTMTLRQAREAYMASLGGAEPSAAKIPSFGGAARPTPPVTAPGAPALAKPGAAPAPSAAASAKPAVAGTGAASAAKPVPPPRRPIDFPIRAPHERNARACSVAAGLKDVKMGDVDTALAEYAPFAIDLAKAIATATTYYQREEFKKDDFAKGKELHKQLTEAFQKLDEKSDKLGAALEAWRKEHPVDTSKMEEGEKLAVAAYTDARDVVMAVGVKKANVQAFKDATGRLEKSVEALKTYAQSHGTDPWGKMMAAPIESMLRAAKEADTKVSDKGVEPDTFLVLVNSFVGVIEQRYRALSRATTMRAAPPAVPRPAPAPHPEGPAHEESKPE